MSTHRLVASPPPRNPRASTGTVYVTSYDTSSSTGSGRNSTSTLADRQNVTYQALPIRKSTYPDGKTMKTEYAVRPRQNASIASEIKRPLSVSTTNTSPPRRSGTLVVSPRDSGSAVARDSPTRYLQPVSSTPYSQGSHHHQRHNSTTRVELDNYDRRDPRDRVYTAHGSPGHGYDKKYNSSRPQAPRHQDEEGWSYTGPREQFDRDFPQRPEERRESHARPERSSKLYEQDRVHSKRDTGLPPSNSRQLDRADRSDSSRYNSRIVVDSDSDRFDEQPRRRQSLKTPVLHQHSSRDDGYSSAREEPDHRSNRHVRDERYDDTPRRRERQNNVSRDFDRDRDYERDRERDRDRDYRHDYDRAQDRERPRDYERSERQPDIRRKPRSRDPSPERSNFKAVAAGALGSLATAGTLGMLNKDSKDSANENVVSDEGDHHHRRRVRRKRQDEQPSKSDGSDELRPDNVSLRRRYEDSSSDVPEDRASRRDHSHRRYQNDERELGERQDAPTEARVRSSGRKDEGLAPDDRLEVDHERRARSRSEQRSPNSPARESDQPTRDLVLVSRQDQQSPKMEARTMSPGENEDDRPRRVQLVEPVKDNQDVKPRGILKPARQVPFPEDPNPIREGVAPLKDATKDGVPASARWTKINRVLVNPEALERYHERFEEREDYVIVLRVLSREEIQKLADKTKEIREAREQERRRLRDERKRREHSSDARKESDRSGDDNDGDEDERPQLAIENGPVGPPPESLNLQQRPQAPQTQAAGQPVMARGHSVPPTDDDYGRNYSHNV